ncbi:hypothetical protein Godav_004955 [Gossypium davidsonii]|uniref:Ribulose bisphosphate carboxylase large subunit C-terminal domain-containing protein n=1 Tax=Gossypium davidsonii TaxID=34287 RepID=A0A7J8SMY5_GOSDV|nr:hypothetical protein [Gossypium davidsonii]
MKILRPPNMKGPFTNNKEDMIVNEYVPSKKAVCDKLEKLMVRCYTHSFEGIHVWHIPALAEIFGDDSILQFGRRTLEHSWKNASGVIINRVALEACVQARNEGHDLTRKGNKIIHEANKWSPELTAAKNTLFILKFKFILYKLTQHEFNLYN